MKQEMMKALYRSVPKQVEEIERICLERQAETAGDLFSIRVTEPYSSDWDECLAGSVEAIEDALPDSAVLSDTVFDVYEEASSSQDDILNWLLELGY